MDSSQNSRTPVGIDCTISGLRLGRYTVLGRLATGGMAEIYLAEADGPEGFRKRVVLKRMLPAHAANQKLTRMFLDEARLVASLEHPAIAQAYDIEKLGNEYFLLLEFVEGVNLRQLQTALEDAGEELPLGHALQIVLGVCAGLHYAHERTGPDGRPLGIVHRDVSPTNVLVTREGCVKVIDFGIAKVTADARTLTGGFTGKIGYMSPEQCWGEHLDRRSDLFSIGILLYELTTGTRLYQAGSDFAVLDQITKHDAEPPSRRKPGYPAALEEIVLRALRRDPEERPPTAQHLQLELERFIRDHRVDASPVALGQLVERLFGRELVAWRELESARTLRPRATSRSRWRAALAGAAIGAALVAGLAWLGMRSGEGEVTARPLEPVAQPDEEAPSAPRLAQPEPEPESEPAPDPDPAPAVEVRAAEKKPAEAARPARRVNAARVRESPGRSKVSSRANERPPTEAGWDPDSPVLP